MNIEDIKPLRAACITELDRISADMDTECAHIAADETLCNLLGYLGCQDVVDAYDKIHKWYA